MIRNFITEVVFIAIFTSSRSNDHGNKSSLSLVILYTTHVQYVYNLNETVEVKYVDKKFINNIKYQEILLHCTVDVKKII